MHDARRHAKHTKYMTIMQNTIFLKEMMLDARRHAKNTNCMNTMQDAIFLNGIVRYKALCWMQHAMLYV